MATEHSSQSDGLGRSEKDYSVEYQKLKWEAMRVNIYKYVLVSTEDLGKAMNGLCVHNLIRGRGILCTALMECQMDHPLSTQPLAALVASVNTLFPEVGSLLAKRLSLEIRTAYHQNHTRKLSVRLKFLAQLVNHKVVTALLALEILKHLLDNPTNDNVEQAFYFVKECGSRLRRQCPRDLRASAMQVGLRTINDTINCSKTWDPEEDDLALVFWSCYSVIRVLQMADLGDRRNGCPAAGPVLDIVKRRDQLTHKTSLLDEMDPEFALDIFKPDPQFLENEVQYKLKKIQIDEKSDDLAVAYISDEDGEESDEEEDVKVKMKITDETEWSMNLRRKIRLAVTSNANYEEFIIDILDMKVEPGQEMVLCLMILECCNEEETYNSYYGRIGQWLCVMNNLYKECFEKCFVQHYFKIHLMEMKTLERVACFFAHLLGTKAVSWHILSCIRLTGDEATSQIHSFLAHLFMELLEHQDHHELQKMLTDPNMQDSFEWMLPKDSIMYTLFCIDLFSLVGLKNVTEHLEELLSDWQKQLTEDSVSNKSK